MKFPNSKGILVAVMLMSTVAVAQTGSYPTRPVRMIAPSGAGGPVDVVCRIVAQGLGDSLGQQVVVENRVGAAGLIGTEYVVRQRPDGYTLLFDFSGPLAIVPNLNKRTPYNVANDLIPIAQVASQPYVRPSQRTGKIGQGTGGSGQGTAGKNEFFLRRRRRRHPHGGRAVQGGRGPKVFSRLARLNPDDLETKAQLARLKLARGDYDAACDALTPVVDRLAEQGKGDKALGLLQQVLQKNPNHLKTLIKLVELQRVLRNDRGIAAAYSQLSEAYIKGGELDRAASVLEILVSLEPQNQQYASKLQFVRNKMGGQPAPELPPLEEESFAAPLEEPALDVEVSAPEMMAPPRPRAAIPAPRPRSCRHVSATRLERPGSPAVRRSGNDHYLHAGNRRRIQGHGHAVLDKEEG